jgi:hypothetical protein
MITSESRYLHKTNSDCEACGDQESLRVLPTDLQAVVDDLGLDFADAYQNEIGKKGLYPSGQRQKPCITYSDSARSNRHSPNLCAMVVLRAGLRRSRFLKR